MHRGEHYWWNKEPGVKCKVALVGTTFDPHLFEILPSETIKKDAVLVRVLAGAHLGMFAIADRTELEPFN